MTTVTGIRLKNTFAIIPKPSSVIVFALSVQKNFIQSFTKRAPQKSTDSNMHSANKSQEQRSHGIEKAGLTGEVVKTGGAVRTDV